MNNKSKSILAALLAVAAFGAGAQTTGAIQGQPTTGETYRPSLDGQQTSTPAPTVDMRPMTQEEKATGRQEPQRLKDIDPATHPQPQNVRPQPSPMPRPQGTAPSAQRPVQSQIDSSTRMVAPVGPTSAQVNCIGATCTDTSGATTTGSVGNASVNSAGRLCTRNGATVQCF